jgi:hypothetical protein
VPDDVVVVDTGNYWRQQPGTPVYVRDLNAEGVRRALEEATQERSLESRATAKSLGTFFDPA